MSELGLKEGVKSSRGVKGYIFFQGGEGVGKLFLPKFRWRQIDVTIFSSLFFGGGEDGHTE